MPLKIDQNNLKSYTPRHQKLSFRTSLFQICNSEQHYLLPIYKYKPVAAVSLHRQQS